MRTEAWLGLVLGLCLACGEIVQRPIDELNQDSSDSDTEDDPRDEPDDGRVIGLVPDQLTLTPGEAAEFTVMVAPERPEDVRVALLGDAKGAYTNKSTVRTDAQGRATIKVTVPTDSEGVVLRVSVGSASAEAEIRVRRQVVGQLNVTPDYSGSRLVSEWGVAIVQGTPCLGLSLPEMNFTQTFTGREILPVTEVPTDRPLTLVVRGDHYVFGCREGISLQGEQEQSVSVVVSNRPLRLGELAFDVRFDLELTLEISQALARATDRMVAAFVAGHTRDLGAVLAHMANASSEPAAFEALANERGWDEQLTLQLTEAGAASGLSSRVRLWVTQAQSALFTEELLRGRLRGSLGAPELGLFGLTTIAGLSPARAGVPREFVVALNAEPEDRMRVGFELLWQPSRLLARLAERFAAQAALDSGFPPNSPADELARSIDCGRVGSTLAVGLEGSALESCDVECLAQLCRTALAEMWGNVESASPGVARMEITAAGGTIIDRSALPTSFAGAWAGEAELLAGEPVPARGTAQSLDASSAALSEPSDPLP